MKIVKLDWDSNFFGYKVGKLDISDFHIDQYEKLMRSIKKSAIKLIYVYPLDQLSKNTLIIHKIPLVTTNITFEKNYPFSQRNIKNIKSFNDYEKYETIEKLALLSGQYSRFRVDPNFTNNEFFRLYTEWIKKSIRKEIATDVIIYKNTGKIDGFVSYKITSSNEIVIGLIAVDSKEQGQGIGKSLMQSIDNIAFQNNIKKIIISAQLENRQAIAFYQSCNYTIKKQQEIFHLWIQ